VQAISNHNGVIIEVDWEENCLEPHLERIVPVYNKTEVLRLHTFLSDKFAVWASNRSSVEELWNNFKNIVHESVVRFVPHKILRKNSDAEYYNKDIKRLKVKVRKACNSGKLGVQCMEKLKHLSKQLLAAKKEAFLKSILKSVNAGLIFTNTLKGAKEIGILFLP